MKNMRNKKAKKGFTLIELVVVIAILGVLAAIAVPKFTGILADSKKNADDANRTTINSTLSTLIARDKLDLKNGIVITFNVSTSSITVTDNTDSKTAFADTTDTVKEIRGAFNNIPKPSAGGNFVATIDATGKITITP